MGERTRAGRWPAGRLLHAFAAELSVRSWRPPQGECGGGGRQAMVLEEWGSFLRPTQTMGSTAQCVTLLLADGNLSRSSRKRPRFPRLLLANQH